VAVARASPIRRSAGAAECRGKAVPAEYSVRVVAVAVAGQRLLPFSGNMTALFIAVLASLRATTASRGSSSRPKFSRSGISWPCCNGPPRNDRASVRSIGSSGWCSQVPGQPGCAGVRGAGLEGWSPDQKKAIVGEPVVGEESGHDPRRRSGGERLQAALASGRS
jgi:hypothetical protein